MTSTINLESELSQYSDFHARNEDIEVGTHDGVEYIGVKVNSHGFSNTIFNVFARADNAEGMRVVLAYIERDYRRQPGDGFRADWMSGEDISGYLRWASQKKIAVHIAISDGLVRTELV